MGAIGNRHVACQRCQDVWRPARERGRIQLAVLCDECWEQYANEIAELEGATAPPWPKPDSDDVRWTEPPTCPECGGLVRIMPTNYDRWVCLSPVDRPAKDVPRRYRWRLQPLRTRYSGTVVDVIAVKVSAIEPMPAELITPAHRALCPTPDAVRETERERLTDLMREQYSPGCEGP
ncbi:DUF6083 domain-containing protein [Streptomyces sp. RPT161]|uniref:DUF6083 domain-containing protein n=1 Tax=Streptomyces sp. RPT161 TaxID=3015993 RepID=UPI0022B85989|nr:DUF6083 domain-containing protein [Streptomyces sp. RPT161]